MVYMYIVTNTTIFFVVCLLLLHVSAINVGHLQVVHEEMINKLYQRVWGVCSLWGEVVARSTTVCGEFTVCFSNTKRNLAPTPAHKL